ncbi:hypothetical protein LTR91_005879 [Friedmanniomyces endolithicus]|uniref:Transmembrane protein UsgS n=1 Tax=Friedmanniomyces endolithicus TaxID=329885 RepID=A0AAN6KT84_9PEZI|nr:hypothetical protein LTR57_014153 [Friedmanniomyces endolithicus]KAK0994132.1 hypothetical protein LTS01_007275 [Friedmanniomyces endolithicus]KAK0999941.1 hypothetical protein LTR91_005879 [Friedmanniomyces endolithicus]KAK1022281.1 hypothetical protein LTS16_025843 [Friedmanniomyces endolithicus]
MSTADQLKRYLSSLHTSFEPNAILRGAQLTFVGANRALQNPNLFTSAHYRQAGLAVALGLAISLLLHIPTLSIRLLLRVVGLFTDLSRSAWDEEVIEGIEFIEHSVLQVPFFLMSFVRYLSPAMDDMFMSSLGWVDTTYTQKHADEKPENLRAMYYPYLKEYDTIGSARERQREPYKAALAFLMRFGRKAGLSLGVYCLTFLPYVGRFVVPAASFYTFNNSVGLQPAVLIFGSSVLLPKRWIVRFLQSYFSSRSLMRELLDPYFSRIHYSSEQKRVWFNSRSGVLYGFAVTFYFLLRVPFVGVLMYGIAEASTAYLITKITEPPPDPKLQVELEEWKGKDVRWVNKHEFLALPLDGWEGMKASNGQQAKAEGTAMPTGKKFT